MPHVQEPIPPTPKGRATRERIITSAAELIHQHGIQGTTNPAIRDAAGVSGSQLSHYFPEKESLVRAVVDWRAGQVVDFTRVPPSGRLDSIAALRTWADSYIKRADIWQGGCRFGALAGEVLKSDLGLKEDVAEGFETWRVAFRQGIAAMVERGDLRDGADPDKLATLILATYQGGMLLAQAARSTAPLADALDSALDYVASFELTPRDR